MKKLPRILEAEPVIHGVLKVSFDDGYVGVVDLRPLIGKGKVFSWLSAPPNFLNVRVDEFGHSLSWRDDTDYSIDLSARFDPPGRRTPGGNSSADGRLRRPQ